MSFLANSNQIELLDVVFFFGMVLFGIFLFFVLPIFLIIKIPKGKSKAKKYQGLSAYFLILGGFLVLISSIEFYFPGKYHDEKVADGFTIENYNVKIDVKENNVAEVVETITTNFTEDNHHGIYRDLPYWLEYTSRESKTESRRFDLDNIEVLEEKYETFENEGKKRIQIGDKEKLVGEGENVYVIKYTYNMGDDPYDGYDEFIFHAFGDYWGTDINNASLEITMPDSFLEDNVRFFTDKYRKNEVTSKLIYSFDKNTLKVTVPSSLQLKKSLTVDIELPDNYFKNTKSTYGIGPIVASLLIIVAFVVSVIKWRLYGKDYKFEKGLRQTPPENYDAASIGYINNKTTGRKLLVATIMELANIKALRIEEENNETMLIKLKTNKTLTSNQQIVYDLLFKDEEKVSLDKLNIYNILVELNKNLQDELDDKIQDTKSYKNMFKLSRWVFYSSVLLSIIYSEKTLAPKYQFLYIVDLVLIIAMIVITIIMKRRNTYGAKIYNDVKSFKDYLKTIKEDELLRLKDEDINSCNVNYAYAYVLNVSKVYGDKLNKVFPKDSYNFILYNPSVIDSLNKSTTDRSGDSSSSGGCSSCGGGGGGCSSCGGGGSW